MRAGLAALVALAAIAAGLPADDDHVAELPPSVELFYEDWNFVVANSLPPEREALWAERRQSARRTENDTHPKLSAAAREITKRMERIADALFSHETGMPTVFDRPPIPSSELLVVASARRIGDDVVVLDVRPVDFPARRAASVRADAWPQKADPSAFPDLPTMGRYTDRWVLRDGSWRLTRCVAVPVASGSPGTT
jgi:hypothetical protein